MRSFFAVVGLLLGLALGYQNCSGPTFSGGAGGGQPSLSTSLGDPRSETSLGDPKIETPLGDTKREVGGEGYTGKIYVQLGTCGEEKNAVRFMVRVNDDQTATVLKENCAPVATRLLARNQYTINVIDATSATFTYTTAANEVVTIPSYVIPPAEDFIQTSRFIMVRKVVNATEVVQDFNAFIDNGDPSPWSGFNALEAYTAITPTRIGLFQCQDNVSKLYFMSRSPDCRAQRFVGVLGFIEPVATALAPNPLYACYQTNGDFMVVAAGYESWCDSLSNPSNPPTVPDLGPAILLGYTPSKK